MQNVCVDGYISHKIYLFLNALQQSAQREISIQIPKDKFNEKVSRDYYTGVQADSVVYPSLELSNTKGTWAAHSSTS
jgi:hypothetical protein